ncbi:uncharacterized protein LOC129320704 [Prosopis cineraria]|uniref:uncharacterized protein LOC129320704 n=1 Tax=Prosopis cineraria TaxID=364024 RepID=UPI00240EBF2C|nr:uncharacterized protein LOC129320704 [Prosopis cineraria]
MIISFRPRNQTQFLILILYCATFIPDASSLIAILILLQACSVFAASDSQTMKVHPVPRKRNITIQFDMNAGNPLSEAQALLGFTNKKLRRLPHVFSRVLELPFRSDADVTIEESPDFFRFVAETDGIGDVQAHMVEIHPGVTKVVVRDSGSLELSLDELELDIWRFRLPESTRPELASAVFADGELIVTVPKSEELEHAEDENGGLWSDGNGNFGGRLVLVIAYASEFEEHLLLHSYSAHFG